MTDGKGFMVERGAGRRTRVEQAATQYEALSADTGGAYTLGEHVLTDDFPLHVHHREDEGLYVLEGRVAATVGADRFSLGPGDFVFMPKGVPHSLESESGTPPRLTESPLSFWSTITVATIEGGTLRRPESANTSANNSSGNNRRPSRFNTAQIEFSPTRPSHKAVVPRRRSPWLGVTPTVTM